MNAGFCAGNYTGLKRDRRYYRKVLFYLARPRRFERPTPAFGGQYSIQLSYGRLGKAGFYRLCRVVSIPGKSLHGAGRDARHKGWIGVIDLRRGVPQSSSMASGG